jgi:metal-sulfur cluster biosynthetic enzyme
MAEPTTPVGAITLNRVLAILLTVNDPCSVSWGAPLNVLEMGLVREAHIRDDGTIFLRLLLTEPTCIFFFDIATDIKARLQAELGECKLDIELLSDQLWTEDLMEPAALERLRGFRQRTRERFGTKRQLQMA